MQSVAAYFDIAEASDLNWAHRINTVAKLEAALADPTLHVIEANITFGASDATPLVAEAGCVAELDAATLIAAANRAGKALKLDFHGPAAIEPTLAVLRLLKPDVPLILHADIFALLAGGPEADTEADTAESLEPEQFLRLCQYSCPGAVLSLGWSLKRASDADGRVEDALIEQVSQMLTKNLGPVNYAMEIRAGYTPARASGAEHGAALIFDPFPPEAPTVGQRLQGVGSNVVPLQPRSRQVA